MIDNEKLKNELIEIYQRYLQDSVSITCRNKSYEIYSKYSTGANILFSKEVSDAIWSSFDLSEGKLTRKDTERILEDLQKSTK